MARLDDGFSTTLTFSLSSTVEIYEKTVTPPGQEGGEEIDTTTMLNSAWRTFSPRSLVTLTPVTAEVAYDPAAYTSILAMLNSNQQVTVNFPDGSSIQFWGFIRSFVPGTNVEGEQPTATITIVPTNQDNAGAEQAPVVA
jgi:hypothetical protein